MIQQLINYPDLAVLKIGTIQNGPDNFLDKLSGYATRLSSDV